MGPCRSKGKWLSVVNDDVKAEVLRSTGLWMRSCHIIAEGVIKMINVALAGKDAVRNAALDALTSCRDNTTLFSTVC